MTREKIDKILSAYYNDHPAQLGTFGDFTIHGLCRLLMLVLTTDDEEDYYFTRSYSYKTEDLRRK
jgi:hypothetical protein